MKRRGIVRRTGKGKAAGGRLQSWGFSLLEVLVSLAILSLFLLGGMALYVSSLKQQAKAREILTAAWLAKGKLEQMGATGWDGSDEWAGTPDGSVHGHQREEEGSFAPPHEGYTYRVREEDVVGESSFTVLSLTVTGPTGGRVTLRVLK